MTYASLRGLPSRVVFNMVYAGMQAMIYALAAALAAKLTGSMLFRAMLRAAVRASRFLWSIIASITGACWAPVARRMADALEIMRAARDAAITDAATGALGRL